LEATVDFDEDIPSQDIGPALGEAIAGLEALVREAGRGMVYRQGVRTTIVGGRNVGKSSLLNALLRVERAIVTPIPGTTRDTLEETFQLDGVPFVLVDTAGLGPSGDAVERLGMERALRSARAADLVRVGVDGSAPLTASDQEAAAAADERCALVVVNKADLPQAGSYEALLPDAPHVAVSALTGAGLPALEERLLDAVLGGRVAPGAEPLVSNPRHRDLVARALASLRDAEAARADGRPTDLIAQDVADAVQALGEITGETAHEDLLASIFARFCIGK
ncbi:MAG: GTPase, partial [Chloroflexota bacterium]